jgi:acid stress chaperone HdeB
MLSAPSWDARVRPALTLADQPGNMMPHQKGSRMKLLAAAAIAVSLVTTPVAAQKIDLSTVTCKDFLESGQDNISYILMWLHGFYTSADDPPIIDFDKMKADGKKLGDYCRTNPTNGLITAAEEIMN